MTAQRALELLAQAVVERRIEGYRIHAELGYWHWTVFLTYGAELVGGSTEYAQSLADAARAANPDEKSCCCEKCPQLEEEAALFLQVLRRAIQSQLGEPIDPNVNIADVPTLQGR